MKPLAPEIDKLRRLGMVETGPTGTELVRVTAQLRQLLGPVSRDERRAQLQAFESAMGRYLARHGGSIVPDSLSVLGQTLEALVPVDRLPALEAELDDKVRLDLVRRYQATK